LTGVGNLTINGPGAQNLIVDSLNAERHFDIAANIVVTFNRITLSGNRGRGSGLGGGIFNYFATLTLNQTAVINNSGQHGGGIENRNGTVRIFNSTVSGNSTGAGGVGI
jgi:hypothetical protein